MLGGQRRRTSSLKRSCSDRAAPLRQLRRDARDAPRLNAIDKPTASLNSDSPAMMLAGLLVEQPVFGQRPSA